MSGLLFAGIFGFELTWPEVALVVIIAGMVMMGFGYLGDFRLSKEHGITFSGAKVDSALIDEKHFVVYCKSHAWSKVYSVERVATDGVMLFQIEREDHYFNITDSWIYDITDGKLLYGCIPPPRSSTYK